MPVKFKTGKITDGSGAKCSVNKVVDQLRKVGRLNTILAHNVVAVSRCM